MENKMVEPSNKKILIAVLVLLLIGGVAGVLVWGYVKPLSTGNLTSNLGQVEAREYFEINVPDDWVYSKVSFSEDGYHVYTSPVTTPECTKFSPQEPLEPYYDRLEIQIITHTFAENETFESFIKYAEDHPQSLTLLDQFEVGGKSNLFVYQYPISTTCSLIRFRGVAQTLDGKLVKVYASGPSAAYETDFKDIFHSLKLK